MSTQLEEYPVTEQLDGVLNELKALHAANARASTVRLLLLLVAIGVVATIGWTVVARAREFSSEKNVRKLMDVATTRLEKNKDDYMRELETLADRVAPVISEAFAEQSRRDMPQFLKALDKERGPLVDNLQATFTDKLTHRLDKMKPELEAMLLKEFPKLQDKKVKDALVANMDRAIDNLLRKYYVEDFRHEVAVMYDTWDQFPPAPAPTKAEATNEDQFLGALIELLKFKLTRGQEVAAR
jgi:hypothetical protein